MATRMTIDFIMGKKFLQGKISNVKKFYLKSILLSRYIQGPDCAVNS